MGRQKRTGGGGRTPRALLFFLACAAALSPSCAREDKRANMGGGEEARRENAGVIYVALGDSTGVGVGAREGGGYVARLFERVERARPGSRLVNLCVSGATTGDVLRAQVGRVGEAGPSLVTVGIGI